MFIALRINSNGQLRRSDMFQTMDCRATHYIPLLRSFRTILSAGGYKHFVPTGLHLRQSLVQTTREVANLLRRGRKGCAEKG